MDEKLELHEIFDLLKKRAGMIVLIILGAMVLAGVISYYVLTPVYEGTTQILVSQEAGEEQEQTELNVQTDLQLVNTYRELIGSPAILGKVIEQLNLTTSVEELKQQFIITSNAESMLIEVTVEDESERKAVDIVNTTATVFQEEVQNIMNVDNVKILFEAEVTGEQNPISPSPLFNIAIAAGLGLIVGIGLAFLFSYLDTSIKTERDVENYLGVPVLTVISPVEESYQDKEETKTILQEKEA